MKADTGGIQSHLDLDVTTLAWCWKATRRDGAIFGFTSHDQNLTIDGIIYYAETGLNATNAQAKVGTSVDNLEVGGMLDSDTITEEELRSGLWDGCEIKVFIVNWKNTTQQLIIQVGTLGDVTIKKLQFTAEMRSLAQFLQNTIGRIITKRCDANFGDTRCALDLSRYTRISDVAIEVDNSTFISTEDLSVDNLVPIYEPTEKIILNMDSLTDECAHTVTPSSPAPTIDSIVYKTTPSSMLFNGTSTYLNLGNNTDYHITNQNFTMEFAVRLSAYSTTGVYTIASKDGGATNREYLVNLLGTAETSATSIALALFTNDITSITTTLNYTFSLNTWYNISISRVSGTIYFHINGTYYAPTTNATNNTNVQVCTSNLYIGSGSSSGSEYWFNGNIDNVMLTVGTSRYSTSTYTPNTVARTRTILYYLGKKILPFGKITWTSGLNSGASMEVKSISGNTVTLVLPMADTIQAGDTFSIHSGCDKNFTSTTGCSNYINQINFRGFPFIPGVDAIMQYPNAH